VVPELRVTPRDNLNVDEKLKNKKQVSQRSGELFNDLL